jgi:uncharacterized delta-60 repeat protein
MLQGDGKIVAAGGTENQVAFTSDFALARYTPDGSLDPSFSGDGMQTTDFGPSGYGATAGALQSDGKIVAVGVGGPVNQSNDSARNFALARYLGG